MDLVNYPDPPACYGNNPCPNSPGPCYCTGKCTINEVYGVDMQRHAYPVTKPIGAAHAAKIAEIQDRNPAIGSAESTARFAKQQAAANPAAAPSFVEKHNAEEDACSQHQLIQDTLSEVADQIALAGAVNYQFSPLKDVLTGLESIHGSLPGARRDAAGRANPACCPGPLRAGPAGAGRLPAHRRLGKQQRRGDALLI